MIINNKLPKIPNSTHNGNEKIISRVNLKQIFLQCTSPLKTGVKIFSLLGVNQLQSPPNRMGGQQMKVCLKKAFEKEESLNSP